MKPKKKRVGTKAQIRAKKERERRIITPVSLVFILLVVIFSVHFNYTFLSPSQNHTMNPASSQLKAAIVDQLSLTFPNQAFIQTATNTLEKAGYTVDYYPGQKITVGFYLDLLMHNYSLIILRVHSTSSSLFTSEPYTPNKYIWEQLNDRVVRVLPFEDLSDPYFGNRREIGGNRHFQNQPTYFGISPDLVRSVRNDRNQNLTIIMMGCSGLANTNMAKALIENGAQVCIGWNGPVSASHTDQTTASLLKHLVLEKQTIKQAVENTMQEVGPDPNYESTLSFYPIQAKNQIIKDNKGSEQHHP